MKEEYMYDSIVDRFQQCICTFLTFVTPTAEVYLSMEKAKQK